MISIERFNEIVEEELKLLPEYVFEELNGGVVVDEKVNLHPKRLADDLYIMGTYSTSPVMGKQIVIYYGSFTKTMPYADEATLRLKIRDTLRHEFRHHMETRAGFFGAGTLIDEDKREMDRYYLMHAKRQEASDTANVTVTREATPEKADNPVAAGSQENTPYKPVSTETIGSLPREVVETQENIPSDSDNTEKIKKYGVTVIPPDDGYLACGYTGTGKMPSEEVLKEYILRAIAYEKDLSGKKVLVTAGPTREKIDPVRFISNHSTGKMGYAIARQAMLRGAEVTLVSGPVSIAPPPFVRVIPVLSAKDMFDAIHDLYQEQDIIIKTAAVADYTPADKKNEKIKKTDNDSDLCIHLERTADILKWLGENRIAGQIICGFSMETQNVLENSKAKLEKKNVDLIAANSLRDAGSGFGTDTNHLTLIMHEKVVNLPLLSKSGAADRLLDELNRMLRERQ